MIGYGSDPPLEVTKSNVADPYSLNTDVFFT